MTSRVGVDADHTRVKSVLHWHQCTIQIYGYVTLRHMALDRQRWCEVVSNAIDAWKLAMTKIMIAMKMKKRKKKDEIAMSRTASATIRT